MAVINVVVLVICRSIREKSCIHDECVSHRFRIGGFLWLHHKGSNAIRLIRRQTAFCPSGQIASCFLSFLALAFFKSVTRIKFHFEQVKLLLGKIFDSYSSSMGGNGYVSLHPSMGSGVRKRSPPNGSLCIPLREGSPFLQYVRKMEDGLGKLLSPSQQLVSAIKTNTDGNTRVHVYAKVRGIGPASTVLSNLT